MSLFLLQASAMGGYFAPMRVRIFFPLALMALFQLSWLAPPTWAAAPIESWAEWQTAKGFYDAGKYEDALKELQAQVRDSASYYYNLGTLYYRMGNFGSSLAYLEKANRMKPHDTDIQYNLSVARSALGQVIGSEKLDPASTWPEKLADRVTLDEVRVTLGFLGLIVILLWIRAYLATRNIKQAILNPAGLLGMLGFAITVSMYAMERWSEASPPAVCLKKEIIRSGPGDQYMQLAQAEAGSKVRLLELTSSDVSPNSAVELWRQIRFSHDGIGWVRSASLLAL